MQWQQLHFNDKFRTTKKKIVHQQNFKKLNYTLRNQKRLWCFESNMECIRFELSSSQNKLDLCVRNMSAIWVAGLDLYKSWKNYVRQLAVDRGHLVHRKSFGLKWDHIWNTTHIHFECTSSALFLYSVHKQKHVYI